MEITTSITVPDFVYQFYQKVSEHLGDRTTEEIMASALFAYAGFVSEKIMEDGLLEDTTPLS